MASAPTEKAATGLADNKRFEQSKSKGSELPPGQSLTGKQEHCG